MAFTLTVFRMVRASRADRAVRTFRRRLEGPHVERHDTHSVGCSQPLDRHDEVSPAARAKVADDPAEGFLHRDSIGV